MPLWAALLACHWHRQRLSLRGTCSARTAFLTSLLTPVAALYASGGMLPYTTEMLTPAFSHTLPPCRSEEAHAPS